MKDTSEHLLVAEDQPAARAPGMLGRALRIIDAGPRYLYRWALVSLAVSAVLAIPIALHVRPAGSLPRAQRDLIAGAAACLCVAVVLAVASALWPAGRRGWLDRLAAPEQRAAIWLSLTVWFPLLLVVVYLKAKATLPPSTVWLAFGYLDKRWVTATYLLGVLAPMLFLVAARRVLAAGRDRPATWRAWLAALAPMPGPARPRQASGAAEIAPASAAAAAGPGAADAASADVAGSETAGTDGAPAEAVAAASLRRLGWSGPARITAGIATALVIAWYFYGPPWFLDRTKSGIVIGAQEDVFLTGFQAIAHGAVPYIGPAAFQYGPGAQLLSYWDMRYISTLSIVGFRESWATFEWLGASILFVAFFLAFGYVRGLVTALLSALIYPALHEMAFSAGQTYIGFYGWSNPLRYAGAITLVLLLPAAIRRYPARRGIAAAAALGLLLGLMSYIAQENLIAGFVGALVVSALLVLSGSAPVRSAARALLWALAGFAVVWVPVLAYYAVEGQLARFLYLYFAIPQAVADGYSNMPYGGVNPPAGQAAIDAPWRTMYYAIPFLLAVIALLVVVQFRPFRVAEHWSRERVTLAATVVTTIVMYQGALLRSDSAHLFGTELVLPGLVIMVATALPRLLGAWRREVLVAAGVVIFMASFLLFPLNSLRYPVVKGWASAPLRDRQRLAAEAAPPTPTTMAAQRVGPGLSSAALCCQGPPATMSSFVQLMSQIHHIVGTRTTYVVDFADGYPGLVYFVANLVPAPTPLDFYTMVMNVPQRQAYLADFRARVMPETYALLTTNLRAVQAVDYRRAYPQVRVITLTFNHQPYYVLLRPR